MKENIFGRKAEIALIERLYSSNEPEFLAIYGRRRVGKTFLVKELFEKQGLLFDLTGEKGASLASQLQNFCFAFKMAFPDEQIPVIKSWRHALQTLALKIDKQLEKEKVVLFFDELPWLVGRRSGFFAALDHFWNSFGSRKKNLLLIVCGSAASWMINRLINNKGGLYNRITAQICLMPFTLAQTREYLHSRNVKLSDKDILELYMCLGGIPHYLRPIERGKSVAAIVDEMCFSKNSLLHNEFDRLFASLYDNYELHMSVVRVLAKSRRGASREELLKKLSKTTGGGMTRVLKELEHSGFIAAYSPYGYRSKQSIYRLIDEYSLFYLTFVEKNRNQGSGYWTRARTGRSFTSWAGFSFESICLKHVSSIKHGLQIGAVSSVHSPWKNVSSGGGAQIDLTIDRADGCINLCEMKFSDSPFTIDKKYAKELKNKIREFRETTKTKKNLFLTMITTHGCRHNTHYDELVANELRMDSLIIDTE
ncbi:MAG: AAA family ATPase [Proteobacteria bacterium]|nr:AAA family ATPase [Pseudomonadota bacterium]